MPQASDTLREKMAVWFGDFVDEQGPMKFLESRGYILTKRWTWIKPVPSYRPSEHEVICVRFLIDEWDMGGFEFDLTVPPMRPIPSEQ